MITKVLITGANGQLGKTLKELYSNNSKNVHFTFLSKSDLDIGNQKAITSHLKNEKYNYVVNCAAYTNVEQSEKTPEIAFKINADAVKLLAQACKETNTTLIHISTDYVFDGSKQEPYLETDKTNPINKYGESKLKGELNLIETLDNYYIIRTSWLYSAYGNNFLRTIFNKLKEDVELKITDSQKGTPTSCIELSKYIFHLINTKEIKFGIYNFSANGKTTWYDFAIHILKNCKVDKIKGKIILSNSYKTVAKRPKNSVLDLTKTKKKYSHFQSWEEGTTEIIELLKNN